MKEGAIKADDVVDAVEAEELSRARRAGAEPGKVRSLQRHPVVDGHSPILPCRGKLVGRRADAKVGTEDGSVGPHVRRVHGYGERQVAHQIDAGFARLVPRGPPLTIELPLLPGLAQ